jgi:hypothetical protein
LPTSRSRRTLAAVVGLLAVATIAAGLLLVARPWAQRPSTSACETGPEHPEWSVARRWDEALLDAIRRALPAPTVHARNLFHTSAAMWDAWAAFEPRASGYFLTEKHQAANVEAARNEAMSYAAYRVLSARYIKSVGGAESLSQFADIMDALCYPLDVTTAEGDTPAAIGNRIAEAVIAFGLTDGSNQADGYSDPDYKPVNPPLVVATTGTTMTDPNRWQPLQLEHMISQNGIPIENGVQQFVGPHWGHVAGFALPDAGTAGVPIDPGPPPHLGDATSDQAYRDQAVEVIRDSGELGAEAGVMIDISPGAWGANPLGTNDGDGHPVNPVTGELYAANVVNQGDFTRVLTEFWADGPKSETPPGHWNVVANAVSDELDPDLRIGGSGPVLDRLEWDVKLYLALNGANHDAAIAAWGLKGHYDSARPISMIRYLAGLGQSSDPDLPSYDPQGLPLIPGSIELITAESSAPGERHHELANRRGEIAVRAWRGPGSPDLTAGVDWIAAADWVPYQLPTFVTPSFAGYISGHSTFSRASAEVLTGFTGSEFFPGGIDEWTTKAGSLKVEAGPTEDVTLQWATYFDAADLAGLSRLYGGIHIPADDFAGRRIGSECGKAAWARAQQFYSGQAERS